MTLVPCITNVLENLSPAHADLAGLVYGKSTLKHTRNRVQIHLSNLNVDLQWPEAFIGAHDTKGLCYLGQDFNLCQYHGATTLKMHDSMTKHKRDR